MIFQNFRFKTYECEILEKIENEKKREKNLKELKKTCGELLTNVRAALQSINTVLLYVKEPGKVTKKAGKDVGKDILKEIDDKAVDEVESLAELEEVDTDGVNDYNYQLDNMRNLSLKHW